jgi:hypothetical protein
MFNTSHMAPVDSPEASLDMINRAVGVVDQRLFSSKLVNPHSNPNGTRNDPPTDTLPVNKPIPLNPSTGTPPGSGTFGVYAHQNII